MKKNNFWILLTSLLIAFTSVAQADHWEHEHHHRHHGHRGGWGYGRGPAYYQERIIYAPAPPPVYYHAPPPVYYQAPPPVYYQAPPVRYRPAPRPDYYYQSQRANPQGLVGGVVGSALGYHAGDGDPVAAGIGAAAGAFLGNRW